MTKDCHIIDISIMLKGNVSSQHGGTTISHGHITLSKVVVCDIIIVNPKIPRL
jgi:hypothetical protein